MDVNLLADPATGLPARARRRIKRATDTGDTRPRIPIGPESHLATEAAIAALATDDRVYQRLGRLVRVLAPARKVRKSDAPRICEMPATALTDHLSAVATFWRAGTQIAPPKELAAAVRDAGVWPGVRELVGVEEAPTMLGSGQILQDAGYNEETGLFYAPNAQFMPVLEEPTKADAVEAARELLNLVTDFPFEAEPHYSAWLALVLTAFSRRAHDGCIPLGVITATTPGSGKTKLADVISIMRSGRQIARTPFAFADEENAKKITSILLAGEALLLFDNLRSALGGPSLELLVTGRTWKDRLLGSNEQPSIQNDTIWLATGNNVALQGDMARRVLLVALTPKEERPDTRDKFAIPDLEGYVLAHRPRLVRAALTILRAYHVAGRPRHQGPAWGSFEAWSDLVRGAIHWLGLPDPYDGRARVVEEADTEFENLRDLVEGFAELLDHEPASRQRGMTVGEIIDTLERTGRPIDQDRSGQSPFARLRGVLDVVAPGRGRAPYDAHKLGNRLRVARGRLVGRRSIARAGREENVIRWTVTDAD
jgi:hypothetical protein